MKIVSVLLVSILFIVMGCDRETPKKINNVQLSKFYLDNGSYSQSISILLKEIGEKQDNLDALLLLANIYYELEYFPDAEKSIKLAIKNGCETDECKLLLLNTLIASQQLNEAETLLSKFSSLNNDELLSKKIQIQYYKDRNLSDLTSSIEPIKSSFPRAFLLQAQFENKKYIELLEVYQNGGEFSGYELLIFAKTMYVLGRYKEAEEILLEARLKDRSDVISRLKIETMEILVKVMVALDKFEEADTVNQAFLKNYQYTGYAVFINSTKDLKNKKYQAVIDNITKMAKANPNNFQSDFLLALAYFGQKNYMAVISILDRYKNSLKPEHMVLLATSYINIGNPRVAVDYLSEDSEDNVSKVILAKALQLTGKTEESKRVASNISIKDIDSGLQEELANLLFNLKDYNGLISRFTGLETKSKKIKYLIVTSYLENKQIPIANQYIDSLNDPLLKKELLSVIAVKQGNLDIAINRFKELVNQRGEKSDYIKLASLYIKNAEFELAFQNITQGFQLKGDNIKIFELLNHLLTVDFKSEYLDWVISLPESHPDAKLIQLFLADYYISEGNNSQALKHLHKVENTNDNYVFYLLAKLNIDDIDKYQKYLKLSLDAKFNISAAKELYDYYYQQNDLRKIESLLGRIEVESLAHPILNVYLAKGNLKLGKYEKSKLYAQKLIDSGVQVLGSEILADTYILEGRYSEGLNLYKKILNEQYNSAVYLKYLNLALKKSNEPPAEILQIAEENLNLHPADIKIRKYLANYYLLDSTRKSPLRFKQAAMHMEYIYSADNSVHTDPVFLNNYAWSLQDIDLNQAINLSMKAKLLQPDNIEVNDTYIYLLSKSGKKNQALALLNDLLQQYPDSEILLSRKKGLGM